VQALSKPPCRLIGCVLVLLKMFTRRWFFLVAVSMLGGLNTGARLVVQARGPVMWTATGMERVGITDAARENRTAELFAARGEYEPFQVVVQGVAGGLHNVTFRIGDLNGPQGHVIPHT